MTKNDSQTLKGIGIILMLWHHIVSFCAEAGLRIDTFSDFTGPLCKLCVAIFVFVSGYGLSTQYYTIQSDTISTLKFIGRRLIKFYLQFWFVYFVFIAFSSFAFGKVPSNIYGEGISFIKNFILDFCGITGIFNYAWWFNGLILSLYLLLIFSLTRKCWPIMLVISLITNKIGGPKMGHTIFPIYEICTYLCSFTLGIILSLNWNEIKIKMTKLGRQKSIILLMFSTLLLLLLRVTDIIPFFHGIRMDAFICLSLALFVFCSFSNSSKREKTNIVSFLGKHSANIYLTHTFLLSIWFSHCFESLKSPYLIFFALLTSSLLISIVIEDVKKWTNYYKLQDYLLSKLLK